MKKTILWTIVAMLMLPLAVSAQAEQVEYQKYTGKIGPYAITMFLTLEGGEGCAPGGYYYYDDRPKTQFTLNMMEFVAINAKGSMHVVLNEYSPKGNHTGTFDGQLETRGSGFSGTFTNSQGKKFHFELMEAYE